MAFWSTPARQKMRRAPARRPLRLEQLEDRFLLALTITDLGTLGGPSSRAWGLNNNGQVVGESDTANTGSHGFVWDFDNGMQDLGTLARPGCSSAFAINDDGVVVGSSKAAVCDGRSPLRAVQWSEGGIQDLGTLPGGRQSEARAINNGLGQVVGFSDVGQGFEHAFLFDPRAPDRLFDLGTLGGRTSAAFGINDAGQIVGRSQLPPGDGRSPDHAFLRDDDGMHDLGTLPGGRVSQAFAINNLGHVVGSSETANSLGHAFFVDDKGMHDLGTLKGGTGSVALAIDDEDEVVGWSTTPNQGQRAVLWDSAGNIADLNDLIPPGSGWTLITATGVHGAIVGTGFIDRQMHAFLLVETGQNPRETAALIQEVSPTTATNSAALATPSQQTDGVGLRPVDAGPEAMQNMSRRVFTAEVTGMVLKSAATPVTVDGAELDLATM